MIDFLFYYLYNLFVNTNLMKGRRRNMVFIDFKLTCMTSALLKGDVAYGPCKNAPVHR